MKCEWNGNIDEMKCFLGQVLLLQGTSLVCVPITFEVLNLKLIYVYVSEYEDFIILFDDLGCMTKL